MGSGKVSGYLLSQWSLSEFGGVLRVVSTDTPAWWGEGGDSAVVPDDAARRATARSTQVGRIGGLGKGERVYAVRFVGNTGYVVTFRQIDPLYTVDLADPAQPRVLGELEISGYSAYLHPIGEDLMLGIGQEADAAGHPLGTQISIFDVSDLDEARSCSRARQLGQGWSEAESDHHAFLFWPKTGLVVVPFVEKAAGFRVGRSTGHRRPRPHRQRRRRAPVDAADPPLARRRRQRVHGVRRGRPRERPEHARRAGLGGVPGAAAAGRRARRLNADRGPARRRQWCGGGGRVVSAAASAGVSGRGSAGGGSGWGLGSPSGTTGSVEDDAGPVPNSFAAVTVNV